MEKMIENGMNILFNDPTLLFISFIIFMICLTSGVTINKEGELDKDSFLPILAVFTVSLVVLSIILALILPSMNESWPNGTTIICIAFVSIGGSILTVIPVLIEWILYKIYKYKKDKAERLAREARQLNNNLKKNVGGYNS